VGGKGIKSIADVAKPAIKAKGGLNALLTRSPLDGALTESTRPSPMPGAQWPRARST